MWSACKFGWSIDPSRLRVPCRAITGLVDSGSGLDSRMTGEGHQGKSEYGKGDGGYLSWEAMVLEAGAKMSVGG